MGTGYGQPPNAAFCPNCRTPLLPGQRFCPACGQATTAPGWQLDGMAQSPVSGPDDRTSAPSWTDPAHPPYAQGAAAGSAQTAPVPPGFQPPVYPVQTPGQPWVAGHAWTPYAPTEFSPGGTPTPVLTQQALAQPPHRRSRKLIAAISAACVLALLLGATAYLYNIFAAQAQVGAARYLPANTVAYGSIDLIAAATNGYHYDPRKLNASGGGTSQDSIQQATGLSWQTDVLPWLGREIAVAVVPKPGAPPSGEMPVNPGDRFGTVLMLQSHDDGRAQAAVTKAANFQKQQGRTVSQTTYGGLTLYLAQDGSGAVSSAFGAGKGWAILASDTNTAHAVIDRLNGANGSNDSLAENPSFQMATNNLPSGRFGTLYVNVKAVAQATMPVGVQANLPFINMYPTAGGYLSWTTQGLRAQVTFMASRGTGISDLHGDTTSLASLMPAHPVYYVGIANLGASLQAAEKLYSAGTTGGTDIAQSTFGVPASDAALQQPAAVAFGAANGAPSVEIALKAPDTSAAQSLLHSTAQAHGWTLKPATIGGESITAVYGPPGSFFGAGTTVTSSTSSGMSSYSPLVATDQPTLIGYAGIVKGTMVFTSTQDDFTTITQTAQGAQPALATQDTFQSLVRQAPQGAASTAFVDLSSFGALTRGSTAASGISARLTAVLVTEVWNAQESQTTVDAQLQQ